MDVVSYHLGIVSIGSDFRSRGNRSKLGRFATYPPESNAVVPLGQPHLIRGICKRSKAKKVHFGKEEHIELVRTYAETPGIDWNKAFDTTGIEFDEPRYGIVVHGVPVTDLSMDDMTNT
jgi:hypothetical protein